MKIYDSDVFTLDNSYSWLQTKKVNYTMKVSERCLKDCCILIIHIRLSILGQSSYEWK